MNIFKPGQRWRWKGAWSDLILEVVDETQPGYVNCKSLTGYGYDLNEITPWPNRSNCWEGLLEGQDKPLT